MNSDIGTDIDFAGAVERDGYKWIASHNKYNPSLTTFRKHRVWSKEYKKTINRVIHCLSHEPIHAILWEFDIPGASNRFDLGRALFLNMLYKEGVSERELKEIVLGL